MIEVQGLKGQATAERRVLLIQTFLTPLAGGMKLHNERRRHDASPLASGLLNPHNLSSVGLEDPEISLPNFCPHLWCDREVLNLDLFRPVKLENIDTEDNEETKDYKAAHFSNLKPTLTFRNLHTLHLNGMMTSYQPLIWTVCWVNANLTALHLEMALEPLFNLDSTHKHILIDTTWSYNRKSASIKSEYLGSHGTGTLHPEFGDGEYLDTQAIKMARLSIADFLPPSNLRYLLLKKLTLMNFVVDAGPITRWFDPKRLETLVFQHGCIDAGFGLAEDMQHVRVEGPKPIKKMSDIGENINRKRARWAKPGEVRMVNIEPRRSVLVLGPNSEPQTRLQIQMETGVKPKP